MAGKRKQSATGTHQGNRRKERLNQEAAALAAANDAPAAAPPAVTDDAERGLSEADRALLALAAQSPVPEGDVAAEQVLPEIDPLATFWTELDLHCRHCQITHFVNFCTLLNAEESPHLVERARANQFNYKRCPVCHRIEYVQHPWTFFDPARKLVVQIRPEWEWHAGGGEEWRDARLEDLFDRWSEQDVHLDVVFGPEQFIDRYLQEA